MREGKELSSCWLCRKQLEGMSLFPLRSCCGRGAASTSLEHPMFLVSVPQAAALGRCLFARGISHSLPGSAAP